jgi:hypothetical protein
MVCLKDGFESALLWAWLLCAEAQSASSSLAVVSFVGRQYCLPWSRNSIAIRDDCAMR